MTSQIVAEAAPGTVLVLGAGGGLEIEALSATSSEWRFVAVDPDETMLDAARERARECGADSRVAWVNGLIFDAPVVICDAATCLLTLHFVPDDGAKLATLRAVRERLRPGAPLLLTDVSLDRAAPDFELWLKRYHEFGVRGGLEPENMQDAIERIRDGKVHVISPQRTEDLFTEAGFSKCELFYAALVWRGWIAYA
ncbi:MAG: class I SAM-dependent methyltransferase [Caulobacteraceae bacterium]